MIWPLFAGLAGATTAHAGLSTQPVLQIPDIPVQVRALIVQWRDVAECSGVAEGQSAREAVNGRLVPALAALGYSVRVDDSFQVPRHSLLELGRQVGLDEANAAATALAATHCAEVVEPDSPIYPAFTPDDPRFSQQWYLGTTAGAVNVTPAWDALPEVASTIRVAILDTGISDHPDISWMSSEFDDGDFAGANECFPGSQATLSTWHGTKVNGIITGRLSDNFGIAGISGYNYDVPLRTVQAETVHYKVLGKCGGTVSVLVSKLNKAVSDATARGVRQVINLSLQADGVCPSTLQSAIDAALAKNMPVVSAAGNLNKDAATSYPGNCRGVVNVAATNRAGAKAWYSNYGSVVTLSAPGGELRTGAANAIMTSRNPATTRPTAYDQYNKQLFADQGYEYVEGTSFAAPMVTAALAMIIGSYNKSAVEAIDIVKTTVRAFPGACTGCGAGILDVNAALIKSKPRRRPPPPPDCDAHPEQCS